ALSIVGIAAFLLLFLGRSRYLLGHVPVLIALALTALPARKGVASGGVGLETIHRQNVSSICAGASERTTVIGRL
ncbi:hypothetical protein, partial [Kribbella sp. NPDC049227]|uniref:hypothetical protein n=1 Tax=Kribbella sp. NPDC049227 TaxID=3364113 RepID=UPI00371D5A61